MRKIILLALVGVLLAGCEDLPFEPGGEDDFSAGAQQPTQASHTRGGMDDGLLRTASHR